MIHAYAAHEAGGKLIPFEFDPGPLLPDQVEVAVESCGICHSDISMLDNEWHMTQYPFVPGHEVVGKITALGSGVTSRQIGERVGVGWFSRSCTSCHTCLSGDQNLCAVVEGVIVGRHGGFADKVRVQAMWATPIPENVAVASAGPLFCGGITVFNPIVQCGVKPTDRVGVVGIGGLGHLALQFLNAWGCEVTAFSSSSDKRDEAMKLGAHHFVSSRDAAALDRIASTLDFILVALNVDLEWERFIQALSPRGSLHFVGAVLNPVPVSVFSLLTSQKSISASPLGSPATVETMLSFAARHEIAPTIETFPFSKVNEAMDHLRSGNARYRIVLTHDN